MEYRFNTPLNGNIAMTYHYHEDAALRRDKSLYKFVWVQSVTLDIEVDHVVMHLEKDEIISFVNINPKFWNVWLLEHNVSYEEFLRRNNGIHQYCIPTSEYSEFIYDLNTRKRYIKILKEFETQLIEVNGKTFSDICMLIK